ncbi:MAG: hypothetical protein WCD18_01400 [Thermosynechococcaceae cyanobacterium]
MSENASLEMTSVNRSAAPFAPLVEDHAAQLMDELFHGLDQAFDRGENESSSPNPKDHRALPVPAPRASLQLGTAYLDELDASLLVPYVPMETGLDAFPISSPLSAEVEPNPNGLGSRFMLCLAWGAFLGTASLWGVTHFSRPNPLPTVAQASANPMVSASPADLAFASEFETQWQQAVTTPATSQAPMAVVPAGVLQAPANVQPATTPLMIPSTPTAIPQTPPLKTEKVLGTNHSAKSSTGKASTQPHPKPSQTVALANLRPSIPVPPTLSPSNAIAVPQLPQLSPQTLPGSNPAPQVLPVGRQAKGGIMVQGILDLGDKSAMLIARNGSTQNVHPGEVLDASGWVFMRVDQGKAIIQRGNEVRAVSGGESF